MNPWKFSLLGNIFICTLTRTAPCFIWKFLQVLWIHTLVQCTMCSLVQCTGHCLGFSVFWCNVPSVSLVWVTVGFPPSTTFHHPSPSTFHNPPPSSSVHCPGHNRREKYKAAKAFRRGSRFVRNHPELTPPLWYPLVPCKDFNFLAVII